MIDGLQSDGNSGDGFYMGGPPGKPAENITIEYCGAFDNRRQGLSITSARNVKVEDSTFADTHGTPPAAGIDLEPNNANSWLDHVEIVNVRTESNSGGGILIVAPTLDGSPDRVNIDIVNHKSVGEGHRFTELGADHLTKRIKYSSAR